MWEKRLFKHKVWIFQLKSIFFDILFVPGGLVTLIILLYHLIPEFPQIAMGANNTEHLSQTFLRLMKNT